MLISKEFSLENFKRKTEFDTKIMPPAVKPVVVLKGSFKEMGLQYGRQAEKLIRRNVVVSLADILMATGSYEKSFEKVCYYADCISKKTPEITEFWKGIAEGADVPLEQVAMLNCKIPSAMGSEFCSCISAWGSATETGELITAGNVDNAMDINYFGVILIAYPDGRNSFISSVALAGQLNGGAVLNDKGLTIMMTAGQGGRAEDIKPGYDPVGVMGWLAMECDTIEDMREKFYEMQVFGASNFLLTSKDKKALVIEYTSAHAKERKSGDFGEMDYIQIANHYLTEDMQISHFEDTALYADSWVRYDTEKALINEKMGKLTEEDMIKIMKSHRLNVKDRIVDDYISAELSESISCEFTPNMRGIDYQTVDTSMIMPSEGKFWIQFGCADRYVSFVPGSMDQYLEFKLEADPISLLYNLEEKAKSQIWKSGMHCNKVKYFVFEAYRELTQAKEYLWEAKHTVTKIRLTDDENEKLVLISQAAGLFSKAQMKAKEALVYIDME